MEETYEFEIKSGGHDYDILDLSFNETTKQILSKYIHKENLKILDMGCGTGVMTEWLCQSAGKGSYITAVDSSLDQIKGARKRLESKGIKNVSFEILSAYDLLELGKTYDLIYCRFLLHHLKSPRKTIKIFYEALNPNGIYVGEEGIIHAAFAYPPTFSWQGYLPSNVPPDQEVDGENRDGDFGMKLFYYARKAGFDIKECKLVQPILWREEEKKNLLPNELAFKKTAILHGMSENDWEKKYKELENCVKDPNQMIAFYKNCQIVAEKVG